MNVSFLFCKKLLSTYFYTLYTLYTLYPLYTLCTLYTLFATKLYKVNTLKLLYCPATSFQIEGFNVPKHRSISKEPNCFLKIFWKIHLFNKQKLSFIFFHSFLKSDRFFNSLNVRLSFFLLNDIMVHDNLRSFSNILFVDKNNAHFYI